jgi:hypothetical protein
MKAAHARVAAFDREQLEVQLAKLMREQPELYETVEAAMDQSKTGPSAANKRKKPTAERKKVDVEPYRRLVLRTGGPSSAAMIENLSGVMASSQTKAKDVRAGGYDNVLLAAQREGHG